MAKDGNIEGGTIGRIEGQLRDIKLYGRKMVREGLVSSRFGNISVNDGEHIHITRSCSMLDLLEDDDIIKVTLHGEDPNDEVASLETRVHRLIYNETPHRAIVHGHPVYAVALSMINEHDIRSVDMEGTHFVPTIPIVDGEPGSEELARNLTEKLKEFPAGVARGHGVFCAAESVRQAYIWLCIVEHACQIKYLVENAKQ